MSARAARVIDLVCSTGNVADVGLDDDFYDAGFPSINALPLLLELETAFDVSIPDDRFIGARTPRALLDVIDSLKQEQHV